MTSGNSGSCSYGFGPPARQTTMEEFDSLPSEARKLYANAPFNYTVANGIEYIKSYGIEAFMRAARENIAISIRNAALDDYGPDHPQAEQGG